jgi:hypothetical protein
MLRLALLLLLMGGCMLPESKDIDNASASVTIATPGGAVHVLLACPPLPLPVVDLGGLKQRSK